MPYALQVVAWVVVLAIAGNLIGIGIRLLGRRRP